MVNYHSSRFQNSESYNPSDPSINILPVPCNDYDYIPLAVGLINEYGINITEAEVRERWSEPHRYFHTTEHLNDILGQIFDYYNCSEDLPLMLIVAIFHDIVYDPQRKDNEEKSAELMLYYSRHGKSRWGNSLYRTNELLKAKELILATKTHDKIHELISTFNKMDCSILDSDLPNLMIWEEQIQKEYSFAGWDKYKERRLKFLNLSIPDHKNNEENLKKLIEYIEKENNFR